jgi:hypothetical protein
MHAFTAQVLGQTNSLHVSPINTNLQALKTKPEG